MPLNWLPVSILIGLVVAVLVTFVFRFLKHDNAPILGLFGGVVIWGSMFISAYPGLAPSWTLRPVAAQLEASPLKWEDYVLANVSRLPRRVIARMALRAFTLADSESKVDERSELLECAHNLAEAVLSAPPPRPSEADRRTREALRTLAEATDGGAPPASSTDLNQLAHLRLLAENNP